VRPSWVEVDLAAIGHNVTELARVSTPAEICAVVKADGYGHGDVPVAEAALAAGADRLAVALLGEGIRLREAGVEAPILVLSEPQLADAGELVRWGLTPTVYRMNFLDAIAQDAPPGLEVHVKVDTGMHRVGADAVAAADLCRAVAGGPLALGGLWTHFPVSEEDTSFTLSQVEELLALRDLLAAEGITPRLVHAANTAAAMAIPAARLDMVRPGIGIYGLRPAPGFGPEVDLRPAMRVVSRVAYLRRHPAGARPSYGRRRPLPRDAAIATVPIGYADGVPRRLAETGGEVLIRGRRHPFAGNVTMDQVVIDVGDAAVEVGDEVVLMGAQGDAEVSADEWAERTGTINWEIVCGFGPRLPRRYAR